MCLSIPARILSIQDQQATVEVFEECREVYVVDDKCGVGDWVLLYGGVALTKITEDVAKETIDLLQKMQTNSTSGPSSNHSKPVIELTGGLIQD